jgi:uncharacterized protein YqgC (DUF456 family)
MVDIILVIIGIILIGLGIAGCILPIIPGPPVSYTGLLLLHFTKYADFSSEFLIFFAFLAIAVTVLDYIVPIWGTKKFGGSKAGIWGATIGMIIGIFFFPPIGIIIGPFLGAFIAEVLKGKDTQKSFKAALGSLFGFMLGVGLKLISSFIMTFYFFKELFI